MDGAALCAALHATLNPDLGARQQAEAALTQVKDQSNIYFDDEPEIYARRRFKGSRDSWPSFSRSQFPRVSAAPSSPPTIPSSRLRPGGDTDHACRCSHGPWSATGERDLFQKPYQAGVEQQQ
eukprot:COSAG05_NODE_499_length_9235_cov_51.826154_1_plen_123_part_00